MSGVDVVRALRKARAYCLDRGASDDAAMMKAASDAIAELIAASGTLKVLGDGRGYFESGQDCERFRAALAACKPARGAQ